MDFGGFPGFGGFFSRSKLCDRVDVTTCEVLLGTRGFLPIFHGFSRISTVDGS